MSTSFTLYFLYFSLTFAYQGWVPLSEGTWLPQKRISVMGNCCCRICRLGMHGCEGTAPPNLGLRHELCAVNTFCIPHGSGLAYSSSQGLQRYWELSSKVSENKPCGIQTLLNGERNNCLVGGKEGTDQGKEGRKGLFSIHLLSLLTCKLSWFIALWSTYSAVLTPEKLWEEWLPPETNSVQFSLAQLRNTPRVE